MASFSLCLSLGPTPAQRQDPFLAIETSQNIRPTNQQSVEKKGLMKTEVIGVSKLHSMRVKDFRELNSILIIEGFTNEKLAVVIPYVVFLKLDEIREPKDA